MYVWPALVNSRPESIQCGQDILQWNNEVFHIVKSCPKLWFFEGWSASIHVRKFLWASRLRRSADLPNSCGSASASRHVRHPHIFCGHYCEIWNHMTFTVPLLTAPHFTCLNISVTAHAVDLWWLAYYVLTRLHEGWVHWSKRAATQALMGC